MTLTTLSIWIFTWKIHLRQGNVKSVENISRRNKNNRTPTKKEPIFWVPVWRFQNFRHLLQNPNLTLMSSFPNNHYWAYTFLNHWALTKMCPWHIVHCNRANYTIYVPVCVCVCFGTPQFFRNISEIIGVIVLCIGFHFTQKGHLTLLFQINIMLARLK